MRLTRRMALVTAGVASASVAGCLGGNATEPAGPDGVPDELVCETESTYRLGAPFDEADVSYTTLVVDGKPLFELSFDGRTIAYGSTLRIALRNRTTEPRTTGPRHFFSIQRRTERGWEEIRVSKRKTVSMEDLWEDGVDQEIETVTHPPDQGFVWDLELTESGLEAAHPDKSLTVCPALGEGTYRFVYWGIPAGPLAGEFTIVGPG